MFQFLNCYREDVTVVIQEEELIFNNLIEVRDQSFHQKTETEVNDCIDKE